MSKVTYQIVKNDDRIFFFDGSKYVLFDSGFMAQMQNNSTAVDGKIGDFKVRTASEDFFHSFINLTMENGSKVTAIFNPMDGYNCLLKGDTLTISDENGDEFAEDCCYFFPFADNFLPIIEGSINGEKCRFFFDSGARFTMFGEAKHCKEKVRSYTEWMALKRTYAELDVYKLALEFPNGLIYNGEGALVNDPTYQMAAMMMNIKAMLGIDIFNSYDMAIITKGSKKGIALLGKKVKTDKNRKLITLEEMRERNKDKVSGRGRPDFLKKGSVSK